MASPPSQDATLVCTHTVARTESFVLYRGVCGINRVIVQVLSLPLCRPCWHRVLPIFRGTSPSSRPAVVAPPHDVPTASTTIAVRVLSFMCCRCRVSVLTSEETACSSLHLTLAKRGSEQRLHAFRPIFCQGAQVRRKSKHTRSGHSTSSTKWIFTR
jgi:hypothetical protein